MVAEIYLHYVMPARYSRKWEGPMKRAYTLVELLVCICVLSMLTGLLIPAVMAAREAARKGICLSNLHQIGVSMMRHMDRREVFHESNECRQLKCETFEELHGKDRWPYYTNYIGERRLTVIDRAGVSPDKIALYWEDEIVHGDDRLAVYLDGHARAVQAGDWVNLDH